MAFDPVTIPAAVSGGSALGRIFRWFRQVSLKVETSATAKKSESGHIRTIELDVRIFNVGKSVTIRKVALIQRPSWWHLLRNQLIVIERAPETLASRYTAPRILPHHVPTGDFQMLRFDTKSIWPPSTLKGTQIAVWHACSNRPVRAGVEPPKMMSVLGPNSKGTGLNTSIVNAP